MKLPPIIHLSKLIRRPSRGKGSNTVNYLEGFWIRLFWDVIIRVLTVRRSIRRPQIKALSIERYPERLSLKRAAFLILPFYVFAGQAIIPNTGPTVFADPIQPLAASADIKPLIAIKEPTAVPQTTLELMWVNKLRPYGTYPNLYAPGNCTLYVASRLQIPNNWGNANNWANAARVAGFTISGTPKDGVIAQTGGDSWAGHVAVVESVNPDGSFVISEMNAQGYGVIDSRTTTTAEFPNFIYP